MKYLKGLIAIGVLAGLVLVHAPRPARVMHTEVGTSKPARAKPVRRRAPNAPASAAATEYALVLRTRLPVHYPAWIDAYGFQQVPMPQAVHVGDATGDGLEDMVAVVGPFDSAGGTRLLRYARDATGALGTPLEIVLNGAGRVSATTSGTIDRSGRPVLVLARTDEDSTRVSMQVVHFGGGLRVDELDLDPVHGGLERLVMADVDRDGDDDVLALAMSRGQDGRPTRLALLLLRNDAGQLGYAGATPLADWMPGPVPPWTSLAAGDFDRDGRLDVALHWAAETTSTDANPAAPDQGALQLFKGDGTGRFTADRRLASATDGVLAASLAAADFDGDGREDLAGLAPQDGYYRLAMFLQGDAGLPAAPRMLPATTAVRALEVRSHALLAADMDGDFRRDLVVRYASPDYLVGLQRHAGTPAYADVLSGVAPPSAPSAAGHLDPDACPELVIATANGLDILGSARCPGERAPPMATPLPPDVG